MEETNAVRQRSPKKGKTMKQLIAVLMITLLSTGAAFAQVDDHAKAKKGAVIGGVLGTAVGAVIGNNHGHHSAKRGAIVGAVAGTAAGAIVGAMMDRQERELRQIDGLNVSRVDDDELKVTVKNEVLFDTGSAALRGASRDALRDMADVFDKYADTTISVEGHTDSVGSSAYNEGLSERRASSVGSYLRSLGVSGSRIRAIGYGESSPRATNDTASGRQLNRRVEIHIRANRA
jgi:outer membrane protein OmpA-like peptidoglycan-associated protein